MDLGTFYLALSVKDIKASFEFYQKLGFETVENGGSVDEKWLVLKNGKNKIGLFQDMFPSNTMTFNPTDARSILGALKENNTTIDSSGNTEKPSGPCYFTLSDPDGNAILIDQHNE